MSARKPSRSAQRRQGHDVHGRGPAPSAAGTDGQRRVAHAHDIADAEGDLPRRRPRSPANRCCCPGPCTPASPGGRSAGHGGDSRGRPAARSRCPCPVRCAPRHRGTRTPTAGRCASGSRPGRRSAPGRSATAGVRGAAGGRSAGHRRHGRRRSGEAGSGLSARTRASGAAVTGPRRRSAHGGRSAGMGARGGLRAPSRSTVRRPAAAERTSPGSSASAITLDLALAHRVRRQQDDLGPRHQPVAADPRPSQHGIGEVRLEHRPLVGEQGQDRRDGAAPGSGSGRTCGPTSRRDRTPSPAPAVAGAARLDGRTEQARGGAFQQPFEEALDSGE